jgi:hypothetical protein
MRVLVNTSDVLKIKSKPMREVIIALRNAPSGKWLDAEEITNFRIHNKLQHGYAFREMRIKPMEVDDRAYAIIHSYTQRCLYRLVCNGIVKEALDGGKPIYKVRVSISHPESLAWLRSLLS